MISLIVLAAGSSIRFGRNKLLEKIGGISIIERVVKSAVSSKADEVVVVLGYESEKIRAVLKNFNCKFVFNENFREGQSSSVKAGVRSVMGYADAVMILPGDLALITPASINKVIEEYEKSGAPVVVASYRGFLGHPILFDKSLFNEIMKISEEKEGLKAIVNQYRDLIKRAEVNSDEVLIDIDYEEDILKILHRFQSFNKGLIEN
ncbi:MAG: nucleotidyltransferase family protein [Candidatus Bathyarchaeia archaeon]